MFILLIIYIHKPHIITDISFAARLACAQSEVGQSSAEMPKKKRPGRSCDYASKSLAEKYDLSLNKKFNKTVKWGQKPSYYWYVQKEILGPYGGVSFGFQCHVVSTVFV